MSQTTNRLIKEMAATRDQQIKRETQNAKEQHPRQVKIAEIGGKAVRNALRELARLWQQIEERRQVLIDAGYAPPTSKEFLCQCNGDNDHESGEAVGGIRSLEREYTRWNREQNQYETAGDRRRTKVAALTQKAMIDTIAMSPPDLAARLKKFAADLEGV